MLGIHDLWLFVLSGFLLNVTPGPDTAYIVGRSIQLGWRGGIAAALGICCGCLVHVFAAAIGLSALLAASSVAFTIVKLIGALYLCWMGIRMVLSAGAANAAPIPDGPASLRTVFWQGVLTNALNPKVALFFLAFLPQFVAADSPHKALAFVILGIIFNINGTLWNCGVAVVAAKAAYRARQARRAAVWVNRSLGALFVYLGVRVAMIEAR
ncbi:LysE family translocator [Bradyrhizobium sp. SYSU BS000235]|uniref:LysE family translocator n=1 Tax=Bradyrhizobium sp. SYSU BS000235 TaxID=3411332 RepID=UPI003C7935C3